ncbi:hypothetical protein T484DRAFT_1748878 [Baffinella frigidus]|nr:hypothetical protein T484DRAFT_1748878 [Cryptophyta sp. CCMP2293]
MAQYDRAGLERRFKAALEHVRETGSLRPSDMRLPIFAAPLTATQFVLGFAGDSFDPQKLGVACIINPQSKGRGPTTKGDWNLNTEGGSANKKATSEEGLFAFRMSARPHKDKNKPNLPGQYYKYMLEKPPIDFFAADPATRINREPYIVMHMKKPKDKTQVDAEEPPRWWAGVEWQACPCSFCGDVLGDPRYVAALS